MWWIALVAAVGAAVLAACVGCGVFLLWRRRYGHGRREGAQQATDQVSIYLACEEALLGHVGGSLYIQRGAAYKMLISKHATWVPCVLQRAWQAGVILQSVNGESSALGRIRHDLLHRERQSWMVCPRG